MAGEKRTKDSDELVRAETTILLDIEGTTTNISFVKVTKAHHGRVLSIETRPVFRISPAFLYSGL